MSILFLAAALLCQDDGTTVFVKDGKAPGVYYGWSPVLDIWGNMRRGVWTLRPDGILWIGAPPEAYETFIKRALTAEEKKEAGTYAVRGSAFDWKYPNGSGATGEIEFNADGGIKKIKANLLRYFPIRHGVPFDLSGYWSNTVSVAGPQATTTQHNNFSFFKGGAFALESSTCHIGTVVAQTTRESQSGAELRIETIRQEVTKVYGAEAPKKMGKYRVAGSALILEFEDGTKSSRFIGTVPGGTDDEQMILIGRALYEGKPGAFPKPAGSPDAPPPPPPPKAKTEQFELDATGWTLREQELSGTKFFYAIPEGVAQDDPFVVIMLGSAPGKETRATDPDMPKALGEVVRLLVGEATVKESGAVESFSLGTVQAVRAPFAVTQEGKTFRVEASCAVHDGNALIALALGSEAAMKKHGEAARALIERARIAGAAPKKKIRTADYELEMPKGWLTKDVEQDGTKCVKLVPPGRDIDNESEYAAILLAAAVGDALKSATDKQALADLRQTITSMAGDVKPQGEPETLKVDGEPAVLLRYAGKIDDGSVILVHGYMVVKHKKAVLMIVAGKEKLATEHMPAVRAGFESLKVKE